MRLDVPTLQCDRCKKTTQNLQEMGTFQRIEHSHVSGTDRWDLCRMCFIEFQTFLKMEED